MNAGEGRAVGTGQANAMRFNLFTGEWVIYAAARRRRPGAIPPPPGPPTASRPHEPACPFCPGNERELPEVLLELGDGVGGWSVRVVPNRFPALTPAAGGDPTAAGPLRCAPAFGVHEVVVESPRHDQPLGALPPAAAGRVIEAYCRRYRELAARPGVRAVFVFRNHGAAAGRSLSHPHSQIVATGLLPAALSARRERLRAFHRAAGRCLVCTLLDAEAADGRRLLFMDDRFAGFVPYAAEVPAEIWIVPRRHTPDFGEITEAEKTALAVALTHALARLRATLHDPDYNFAIHSLPAASRREAPALHWFLQIQPRLTIAAGFEMASGMRVNPSLPEGDAARLRH